MPTRLGSARLALAFSLVLLQAFSMLPHAAATPTGDGLALALHGQTNVVLGRDLPLVGVAYAVRGLADLTPAPGATVEAKLEERRSAGRGYQTVSRASTRAERDGAFHLSIEVPERVLRGPRLTIRVSRGQSNARGYVFGVNQRTNITLEVLADRRRYEPGETIHTLVRARSTDSGEVRAGLTLHLIARQPNGQAIVTRDIRTSASGVALLDIPLASTSADGSYAVAVNATEPVGAQAQLSVQVARRTVERLLVTAEVDDGPFAPSAAVRGQVVVRAPSGSPVRNAQVSVTVGSADALSYTTDAEGVASLRFNAPAYISGETQWIPVAVRAAHPAHGSLAVSTRFLVSRVPFLVEARAENSALVPEVESQIYFSVSRPGGGPAPEGMVIEVSGDAVAGGTRRLTLDAHGLASLPARLSPNDAGPNADGGFATDLDVELGEDMPFHASVTVPVAMAAQLRPRVRRVVVAPGEDLWIDVARRPSVSRAPVLLTLFGGGRPLAFGLIAAGQSAGKIRVPDAIGGVVRVLARPLTSARYNVNLRAEGAALMGVGASDAVLVRPADAFSAELTASQGTYSVGERAELSLRRTPLPVDTGRTRSSGASRAQREVQSHSSAFTAIVARDLAAHGGEQDFALTWLNTAIDLAEADPSQPGARLLLRASLTTRVGQDTAPRLPQPIDPEPWYRGSGGAGSRGRGALLDPIQARENLLRQQLAQVMMTLEQMVTGLDGEAETRRGVVVERGGRRDFDPEVIANLVANHRLAQPLNLGARPLTLAMLRSADASFRFDTVARRVARRKLLKLLLAVSALSDPDNDDAARVARSEPPTRWLAALLNLGLLERTDLLDPWGHAFVLRVAAGGHPRFPVASSAPTMEVVSPGPDGRAGTADDVRDPFARVVTQGTLYAVASGEDAAMRSISSLSPGPEALAAMAVAFDTLGLAAAEETRGDAAFASASEGMGSLMGDMPGESFGAGGLGMMGTGRGGGGSGYGRGAGPMRSRAARAPSVRVARASVNEPAAHGSSVLARAGEHIRERFPATLFFLGELALDDDVTQVEIPLADALTTYRIEAISWTTSGFTTNARVEIQVQQDATVDAPVPPYANVGDDLSIPIRAQNHTTEPMEVLLELSAEGLSATLGAPIRVTIPPQDAIARTVHVRLDAPGAGALVARVVKAADGSPLDAVRRPLTIYPESRLVREERRLLFRSDTTLEIEVPEDATERGPAELYLTAGEEVFGDLYGANDLGGGWVLAALGRDLPPNMAARGTASLMTRWHVGQPRVRAGADDAALAFSLAYLDPQADDDLLRAALEVVSDALERHPEESGDALRRRLDRRASILLLLAPAYQRQGRPALREDLERLVTRLTRLVRERALSVTEHPTTTARAAAALAMIGESSAAEELAVRTRRELVQFGDRAFLEPISALGVPVARVEPTGLLAIAEAKLGHEDAAMRLLRSLLVDPDLVSHAPMSARLGAALAAGLLGPPPTGVLTLEVDGETVSTTHEGGVFHATLAHFGQPGPHRLRLRAGAGTLALGRLELRYARPWTSEPARSARLVLRVDGAVGARDTRSGLRLTVENQSPRMMARPVIEVDLPAGVELNETTRQRLGRVTRTQPSVEGRTLTLALRALPPRSRVRIPLPLRFAVSGALRGLGVVAYDGSAQARDGVRPTTLLAPRTVQVADEGAPPAEIETEPPARPPPPPPPIELLRRTLEVHR